MIWGQVFVANQSFASFRTGDPRTPGTLHHKTSEFVNDYEEAIMAIDDALSPYSSSKEYVVWGFGAKFGGVVRHIFQCGSTPTASGVQGVLDAYRSIFQSDLVMSGPTVFVQVLQAAALRARKHHVRFFQSRWIVCVSVIFSDLIFFRLANWQEQMKSNRRYCVLLIITDGMVDDVEETKRKLHVYRGMPLSVIIVGVGRAEFKGMNALCNEGTRATFVEFRQHQSDPSSMAKAALKDLPRHIVDYMTENGISPIDDVSN